MGVDGSAEMVRQAQDHFGTLGKAHCSLGTAKNLPFADRVFDAVTCMGVIEFVDNDGCALEEMVRVLTPGGTLIAAFPNKISPFRLWRDYVFYLATKEELICPIVIVSGLRRTFPPRPVRREWSYYSS